MGVGRGSETGFGKCKTQVGMLVLRDCGEPALGVCVTCNRPICQRHQVPTSQGVTCPDCAAQLPNGQSHREVQRVRYRSGYYSYYGYHPHHFHDHDYDSFDQSRQAAKPAGPKSADDRDHDHTES